MTNITKAYEDIAHMAANSPPVNYIRRNPFSTMAICNIFGDLGFIGFAIEPNGTISKAKLIGAACTIPAHLILLACGDDILFF